MIRCVFLNRTFHRTEFKCESLFYSSTRRTHFKVFVVHAGLSRFDDLAIDYINELDHTSCTVPSVFAEDVEADDLVWTDLLWSDPMTTPGVQQSARGLGVYFGPDMTEAFCQQNNIEYTLNRMSSYGSLFFILQKGCSLKKSKKSEGTLFVPTNCPNPYSGMHGLTTNGLNRIFV